MDRHASDHHDAPTPGTEKDPADWVTGDEPMTGAQASYLSTLATETGDDVPDDLTKAEASELIDELRSRSDRVDGARAPTSGAPRADARP